MEPKPEEIAAGYIWLLMYYPSHKHMFENDRESDLIALLKANSDHIDTMKAKEMIDNFKEHAI